MAKDARIMVFELIPFPISIILAAVFVIVWIAVLWKLRRRGTVYSILFRISLIFGVILFAVLLFSVLQELI